METIEHKEPGTYYVDLDGTLAHYTGWKSPEDIGEPIPAMMERVKAWLMDGKPVKIFTARFPEHHGYVREWLFRNGLGGIPVTNVKGIDACEFWDDLAVPVERNTGRNLIEAIQSMRQGRTEDMEVVKTYMEDAGQFRATIEKLRRDNKSLSEDAHRDSEELRAQIATMEEGRDAHVKRLEEVEAERDELREKLDKVSNRNKNNYETLRSIAGMDPETQGAHMVQHAKDALSGYLETAEATMFRLDTDLQSALATVDELRAELEAVTKVRNEAIEKWKSVDDALARSVSDQDNLRNELTTAKADRDEARRQVEVVSAGSVRDKLESLSVYETPDQIELRDHASVPVKVRIAQTARMMEFRWLEICRKYGPENEVHGCPWLEDALCDFANYLAAHAVIDAPAGVPSVPELVELVKQNISVHWYENSCHERIATTIRDAVLAGVAGEAWKERMMKEDGCCVSVGGLAVKAGLYQKPIAQPADQVEALARVLCFHAKCNYDTSHNRKYFDDLARAAIAHFRKQPIAPDLVEQARDHVGPPQDVDEFKATPFRDPTESELESPLFESIWQTIKAWDIGVPGYGRTGAQGNHVAAIMDAFAQLPESEVVNG